MKEDANRWDQRYEDSSPTTTTPTPPEVLVQWPELLDHLPTNISSSSSEGGKLSPLLALDVACGLGAQSLWLAQHGAYRVIALDVSSVAIQCVEEAWKNVHEALQRKVWPSDINDYESGSVKTRLWDIDDGIPEDISNLSVLLCQRFRPPPGLYQEFVERLVVGGILIVTILSSVGLPDGKSPGRFHAPQNELLNAYQGHSKTSILYHHEGHGLASIVVKRTIM